jgi:hypothetical protein
MQSTSISPAIWLCAGKQTESAILWNTLPIHSSLLTPRLMEIFHYT